ncbi:cysteine hydrolase [Paenalcaligenes niemegkensis]|uniref:cysteine hydrolase family protein n=1 Tax=Paenalcaligenes niemegkensis TaxID=2895469 RepID=UPI001EE901FC|nr:isochorismatase family cysteine hydrolase [Paenalcaligenes niemegkensis]MCQ9616119.1 cysteine hydrolase [Paenalcaligenes niemegkensis]
MHNIQILSFIREQAIQQRQGHPGPRPFKAAKTAHLIIDMQNGFLEPGAAVEVPMAREIVGNVNRISLAVRQAGGINAFLRFTHDPAEKRPWNSWYYSLCSPQVSAERRNAFTRGAHEGELWPGLDVSDDDWILDKTRFSAFVQGTCDLDQRLQEAGIETVIISGTLTNCCSEATARDAHQLGYNVMFLTDANAALSDEEHNASLNNLYVNFADLVATDELLSLLGEQRKSTETPVKAAFEMPV